MRTVFFNSSPSILTAHKAFLKVFNSNSLADTTLFLEKPTDLASYSRFQDLIIPSATGYASRSFLFFFQILITLPASFYHCPPFSIIQIA
jgi:hypothetical protein